MPHCGEFELRMLFSGKFSFNLAELRRRKVLCTGIFAEKSFQLLIVGRFELANEVPE